MTTLTESQPLALTVTTFTNGFGDWRARVDFSHTLSESDPREDFNVSAQWPRIRRAARRAIVRALAEREQTARETLAMAESRVRETLPRLDVIEWHEWHSANTSHGVTIGEYIERTAKAAS